MYMVGSPKAARASSCACTKWRSRSPGLCTTRMPRPPPPAEALRITGYPIVRGERHGRGHVGERLGAGRDGHAGLVRHRPGARLVADARDVLRARPDEHQAVLLAHLGELGVLAQEPVPGVDRLGARHERRREQVADVEVGAVRGRGSDADRLVGQQHGQRRLVGLRVGDHRRDAQLARGAEDPQGDLPAVGDQDLLEHGRPALRPGRCGRGPVRTRPGPRCAPPSRPRCRRPRTRSRSSASSPR